MRLASGVVPRERTPIARATYPALDGGSPKQLVKQELQNACAGDYPAAWRLSKYRQCRSSPPIWFVRRISRQLRSLLLLQQIVANHWLQQFGEQLALHLMARRCNVPQTGTHIEGEQSLKVADYNVTVWEMKQLSQRACHTFTGSLIAFCGMRLTPRMPYRTLC